MSAIGVGTLLVLAASVAAAFVGLGVRRLLRFHGVEVDNDIIGWVYSGVAVVNAVLLAFVVFAVYDRYSNLREVTTQEAATLVVVYRDTQTFPPLARVGAQRALVAYADEVIAKEWQSHGAVNATVHRGPDALNPVWAIYRTQAPGTADSGAQDRLHELERLRHLRHLAAERSLPSLFWPVLIGGALITVVTSYFFAVDRAWLHAFLTGSLTAVLVATLLLIFALNLPFTGPAPISKSPYRHALLQFVSLDR